jgi:NAD dependent epimerase/dehydratase
MKFWNDKSVLVTGAGGFIGSHLTDVLVRAGAKVRAFVRYNSRGDVGLLASLAPDIRAEIEIMAGDLQDFPAVQVACQRIRHVFHLGALIAIPYSYRHPHEVIATNILGTMNILTAARQQAVERVVHTSTSEVYGSAIYTPIDEQHPLQGQSPYSASKIGADKIAESFFCAYDLPVVTVRPFNTYGPRQSTRAVIPTIITQALTKDRVRLGNTDTRRDLTYVTDTVAGFLKAGETSGVTGQTINLGSGTDIRISDLAAEIIALVGRPITVETDPNRFRPEKSEVQRLLANNARAKDLLGWEPRTSLQDGLEQTISWVRENINRYQPEIYQV